MIDKLRDIKYIAETTLKGVVSQERIISFCEAGYMPHYNVDGGLLFYPKEVKEWASNNLIKKMGGINFPNKILVVENGPKPISAVPDSIHNLNLYEIPSVAYRPGIYFLCNMGEVVYVGQAVSPGSRCPQHITMGKVFDSVFVMPCPLEKLDIMETEFILRLRPKLNGCFNNGKMVVPIGGRQ